jgi:hypothetical protein
MYALALNVLETSFLDPMYNATPKSSGDFLATYTREELETFINLNHITEKYPSAHIVQVYLKYTIVELNKECGNVKEHEKTFPNTIEASKWKETYRWENNNFKTLEIKEQFIPF